MLNNAPNNAGVATISRADWTRLQDYRDTMDVNLFGLIDVTATFMPLVKNEKGRIVNICKRLTFKESGWTDCVKYGPLL